MTDRVIKYFKNCAALSKCAAEGDISGVTVALKNGADVHYLNDSALNYSARARHAKIVQILLEHGANVNSYVALVGSVEGGHVDVVQILLDWGADADAIGEITFNNVGKYGHTGMLKLLLNHACKLTQRSIDGAFQRGAKYGHVEIVIMLLELRAQIHLDDDYALRLSAANGHTRIVAILLEWGANVHARNDDALKFSIKNGHGEIVAALLEHGANSIYGLECCAYYDRLDLSKQLLENGVRDQNNYALRYSAERGNIELVTELIDRGADVNAHNGVPLLMAVTHNHLRVVIKLLDSGARADDNALHYSICNGNLDIMKELLNSGADITFVYPISTPNMCDVNGKHFEIINELFKIGASSDILSNLLLFTIEINNLPAVKFLLEHGANLHYENDRAWILSVEGGDLDIVATLLEYGADVRSMDDRALKISVQNGNSAMVTKLIEAGANVGALTEDFFANIGERTSFKIILALLKSGIDVRIVNALNHVYFLDSNCNCSVELATSRRSAQELSMTDLEEKMVTFSMTISNPINGNRELTISQNTFDLNLEIIVELLAHRVSPRVCDDIFLRYCAQHGHTKLCIELLKDGASNDAALGLAACNKHASIVDALLEYGANVRGLDSCALRCAASAGHFEIVTLLLEHESQNRNIIELSTVDVHAGNNYALRFSAANGFSDVVLKLLAHGADVDAADYYALIHSTKNNHLKVVTILLEHGACLRKCDHFLLQFSFVTLKGHSFDLYS